MCAVISRESHVTKNIGANVCRALHSVVIDIPRCVKDSPHLRRRDVYEGIVLEVAGGVVVDGADGSSLGVELGHLCLVGERELVAAQGGDVVGGGDGGLLGGERCVQFSLCRQLV